MGQSDTVSLLTTLTSTSAFAPQYTAILDSIARLCQAARPFAAVLPSQGHIGLFMVNIGRVIAILAILGFSLLVHITNGALHNEQIGFANPMDFDTVLIIPLDHAANRFASIQHNHHGCASLHLLDVVKALGVRLIRRSRLSTLGTLAHLVLDFRK